MQKESNIAHGIKWGIIIGAVYCIMLFLRYSAGDTNPIMLAVWSFVGYAVVIGLLSYSGFDLRKKSGGYIDLKEAFKILFLSVLIFELFYTIFNFIYLKYIDPQFFETLKSATRVLLEQTDQSQDKIDEMLSKMDTDAASNQNIGNTMKSYLFSIMMSGICALIIALIIRKNKPAFPNGGEGFA